MPTSIERFRQTLRDNAADFGIHLRAEDVEGLSNYYALLMKWNPKLHLVAPCSPEEFATRHILESLMLLRHLPTNARVTDVGSGAGLPTIPCLLVRRDLQITLTESSQKKIIFLREALREIGDSTIPRLIEGRFEDISAPETDFVTCRALDRFHQMLPRLIDWAPPNSTFLLFAGQSLRRQVETRLPSAKAEQIPGSERRFLIMANKAC